MFYFCFIHLILYQSIPIHMFFSQAYIIFSFTMFFCTSLSGLACFGWSDVELLQGMFWCKVWVVLRCCKYIHQVHSPPTTQIGSKFIHTLRLSRRSQVPVLRWFGQVVELLLNKHMFNSAFFDGLGYCHRYIHPNSPSSIHPICTKLWKHILHIYINQNTSF